MSDAHSRSRSQTNSEPTSSAPSPVEGLGASPAFDASARTASTRRAYRTDWKDFVSWCERHDVAALPAGNGVVAAYVADRVTTLAPSTLRRRLAAINQVHVAHDHPKPGSVADEPLAAVWDALVEPNAQARHRATPILLADLRTILAATHVVDNDMLGCRDRALLLLGWTAALRRSEIASLDVGDVNTSRGDIRVVVRTPPPGLDDEQRIVHVPVTDDAGMCPRRAVDAWSEQAGVQDGPLFRSVSRWGHVATRRLTGDGIHRIIKKACDRAGLDADSYSGHSLRAGFITQAMRAGISEQEIMDHSGHSDPKTLRQYLDGDPSQKSTLWTVLGL